MDDANERVKDSPIHERSLDHEPPPFSRLIKYGYDVVVLRRARAGHGGPR